MSELIYKNDNRAMTRWRLLAGVSALTLTAHIVPAKAEDASRPTVWIELGGQFSRLQDSQEIFSPTVMADRPDIFDPSEKFEKTPIYSLDGRGAITLRPSGSHWVFNASAQYGRSQAKKHVVQKTSPERVPVAIVAGGYISPLAEKFAQTDSKIREQHTLIDFKVGRDVGVGLFGHDSNSVVSAGVRFAQFSSGTNISSNLIRIGNSNIYTFRFSI